MDSLIVQFNAITVGYQEKILHRLKLPGVLNDARKIRIRDIMFLQYNSEVWGCLEDSVLFSHKLFKFYSNILF